MKIQDILFFFFLFAAVIKNNSKITTATGIICLLVAMPLFAMWVFFTAERLTWYAVAFFFVACVQQLWRLKNENRN